MKNIFTFLILLINLTLSAQKDKVIGEYKLTLETKTDDIFKYELTLNSDGTFAFHYYSNIKFGIPPEKNYFGKGHWTIENDIVSFISDKKNDVDEKYTLDFSDSKARFITKSPRDKSDRIIKTKLQFLKSEIPWMSRIEILKL